MLSRILKIGLAGATLLVAGCIVDNKDPETPVASSDWSVSGPAHYSYTVETTCDGCDYGLPTYTVTVSRGRVLAAYEADEDGGDTTWMAGALEAFTIDSLLRLKIAGATIQYTLDSTYGFPMTTRVTRAGGATTYTITGFHALRSAPDTTRFYLSRPFQKNRLPTRFSYTLQRNCFCGETWTGPFRVTATRDSVLLVRRAVILVNSPPGVPKVQADSATLSGDLRAYGLDSLSGYVREALNEHPAYGRLMRDARYGYPKDVYFDFDFRMADEENGFEITDFVVLEP